MSRLQPLICTGVICLQVVLLASSQEGCEFIVDPMDETLEVNETDVVLTCTPALSDMNQLINWEIYLRNGTFWVVTGADPERQRRQGLEFIPVVQSLKIIRVQTFHAGLYRCRGVKATVPICVYFSDNATITVRAPNLQQFRMEPGPVEYDSGRSRAVGETGLPIAGCSDSPVTCVARDTPIGDGSRVPTSLSDLSSTFAWNEDVTIIITLAPAIRVRAVNLFFYNIPSMGIGLPHEIELNWGTSTILANNRLGHAVLGNSDLSQEDNTTRNVTIVAIAEDSGDETDYGSLSITFHFSDANPIRWVILSEVEICTDQVNYTPRQDSIPLITQGDELIWLQPNNIQSKINFTCTVEIEGSFQWVWSGPAVDVSQQVFANTNRTSSITLSQLSSDSAGNYNCTATYDPRSLPMGVTTNTVGSRIFTLQLESAGEALNNTPVVATTDSSVTLSCEIYGYLPRGSQPQITWRRINGETISSSSPPYTLSMSDGPRQIQNGGDSPRPSYVSSLTIDVMDKSVADNYTCSSLSSFQTIQLVVEGAGSPPTSATGSPQINIVQLLATSVMVCTFMDNV